MHYVVRRRKCKMYGIAEREAVSTLSEIHREMKVRIEIIFPRVPHSNIYVSQCDMSLDIQRLHTSNRQLVKNLHVLISFPFMFRREKILRPVIRPPSWSPGIARRGTLLGAVLLRKFISFVQGFMRADITISITTIISTTVTITITILTWSSNRTTLGGFGGKLIREESIWTSENEYFIEMLQVLLSNPWKRCVN